MSNTYLELLKQMFGDPTQLSPEKLEALIEETMKFFREIQEKIQSNDPKLRDEALQASLEVKQALEQQMDVLCKMTGLDHAQLMAMAKNPNNMNSEEWKLVEEVRKKLAGLSPEDRAQTVFKKQAQKIKIMG